MLDPPLSGSNESLPSYSSSDHKDCDLEMEHDIYDSENAKIPLFENSDITVLQALASYFMWFTEHPSTSKSALSDLLRLKKRLLPQPNNLVARYGACIITTWRLACMLLLLDTVYFFFILDHNIY